MIGCLSRRTKKCKIKRCKIFNTYENTDSRYVVYIAPCASVKHLLYFSVDNEYYWQSHVVDMSYDIR